jgi:hypothetical protein
MNFRPTTQPTALEEAFASALRLRLKEDHNWCFQSHSDNAAKPITLRHKVTGEVLAFSSYYQAAKFLNVPPCYIRMAQSTRGWIIEK